VEIHEHEVGPALGREGDRGLAAGGLDDLEAERGEESTSPSFAVTRRATRPSRVNLMALPSRFRRTCVNRFSSARTHAGASRSWMYWKNG
jgi:hypothetical protein